MPVNSSISNISIIIGWVIACLLIIIDFVSPILQVWVFIGGIIISLVGIYLDHIAKKIQHNYDKSHQFDYYTQHIDSYVGDDYLRAMADGIINFLEPDVVIVSRFLGNRPTMASTTLVRDETGTRPNFEYCLSDTPCGLACDNKSPVAIYKHVIEKYPNDHILADMGIEAYVGMPLVDHSGKAVGIVSCLWKNEIDPHEKDYVGILQLITNRTSSELARVLLERDLYHKSHHDCLTGLPNRQYLSEKLREYIKYTHKSGISFDFILIDIDNFKSHNDTYGHYVGDGVLQEVAKRLAQVCTTDDFVARLAGDEFIILRKNTLDMTKFAQNIRNGFVDPVQVGDIAIDVTLSMGSVKLPDDTRYETQAYKYADFAMYMSKRNGRNTYSAFDKKMYEKEQYMRGLQNGLTQAIANREIYIQVQPIVPTNSTNNNIVGEVLARWKQNGKSIEPDEFIKLAERDNNIHDLGRQIVVQACELAQQLNKQVSLMVNCSVKQFEDPDFIDFVGHTIRTHGLDQGNIILEITETILAKDDYIEHIRRKTQEHNIQLAIDDFGTGYASLSYITKLPATVIKLDQSFVKNLGVDLQAQEIVKSVANVADVYNCTKIAEGIEDRDSFEFVKGYYDYVQGVYMSPPLSVSEFKKYYKDRINGI